MVGTHTGLRQYEREMRMVERRAVRKEALKNVEKLLEDARRTRVANPLPGETALEDERASQSTETLLQRANLDCRGLLQISKRSGNLKGTCQRGITDAVASFRQVVDEKIRGGGPIVKISFYKDF